VYALFEICSWKGSQIVISAISTNMPNMVQALLLGFLFMYSWMIVGMLLLRDAHEVDTCSNMFQCFFAYIFLTIRGDGVREVLTKPGENFPFPHNIVDALSSEEYDFMLRFAWDITFQIIFIYILVDIITGIVIDGFGDLKAEKEEAEEDLNSICFVCNVARFRADQEGIGFDKHIKVEHNPRSYLFFLIYLQRKEWMNMNGQEKFIYGMVWPRGSGKRQYKWLPREQTFTIEEQPDENSAQAMRDLSEKTSAIEAKLDSFGATLASAVSSLARIEASLPVIATTVPSAAGKIGRRDPKSGRK
jgi:hypothetical protein